MKLKRFVISGLVAAVTLAAPLAHAAYVVGSASTTGFFQNSASEFVGYPTSLVSILTAFDVAPAMIVGATSGDLLTSPPTVAGTASDFTFLTEPQTMFMFSGFTFEVQDWGPINSTGFVCTNDQCSDAIAFSATGSVNGNGFQTTEFLMGWSAQGSCIEDRNQRGRCGSNATASWSASLSATGAQAANVPEPATLALVGFALVGAGLSRRRRA